MELFGELGMALRYEFGKIDGYEVLIVTNFFNHGKLDLICTECRNALIFQDKMYSPQESVLKAQSLFMEIQDSSTSPGCTQSHSLWIPRSREAYRWQCPSRHHYKMNTDVAKISDVEWSTGVVIRSDQGHLFMTGIKTILAPDEVAVAEALGIRWGLQIAQQCHVSKLEVETDCEVVVNSFNAASATDLSLVSDIMADCRSIGAELESFSLRHIYRESNHVAHFVAKRRKVLEGSATASLSDDGDAANSDSSSSTVPHFSSRFGRERESLAKTLKVDRVAGKSHQAGSDSLLTLQTFMKLKDVGSHDFGYLIKILIGRELPYHLHEFNSLLVHYFGPRIYDMKHMMKFCNGLYGGLESLAKTLKVDRVAGKSHQAGSDSLLTLQTFMKLKDVYFEENYGKESLIVGVLHGLEMNMLNPVHLSFNKFCNLLKST
ncbi:putative CCR4-associated factor 1-like protein 11 [Senna tora]|uniref:Putative CCR4-associated factor 1-like protein 11 n=1 Tax=Senna tora TaxID=362788 RepID=A0A834XKC3_9FABA|nr:putative CCR4-associated factor 1-like protein 11 [Senna tora]